MDAERRLKGWVLKSQACWLSHHPSTVSNIEGIKKNEKYWKNSIEFCLGFLKKISIFGFRWCWPQGKTLIPSYQMVCWHWHHSSACFFPFLAPCPTEAPTHAITALSDGLVLKVCKSLHKSNFLFLRWLLNQHWLAQHPCHALNRYPRLLKEQRYCRTCLSSKDITFRLLSKNQNNPLFQPLEFTKTLLASDLTDLFWPSVGLLLTQTWLCIVNQSISMNLPLNKYFKGSIKFHSTLLPYIAVFLFNFHTRCLSYTEKE